MRNVNFAIEHHQGAKGQPAVMLVHSDAGNKEQFTSTFQHLKGLGCSVASFDRRGHGQSSPPDDAQFGYATESDDIFDVADAVGFDRFVAIGHSGGGSVAFKAANDEPERMIGLLLIDPPPDPAIIPAKQKAATAKGLHDDFKRSIGQYYRSIAGPKLEIADQIVSVAQATPAKTVVGINEHLDEFMPRRYAGRFKGPAHSVIQPQSDIDGALHRLQEGMTHEEIGGAGHWIHMVAPTKFEAALDSFLNRMN